MKSSPGNVTPLYEGGQTEHERHERTDFLSWRHPRREDLSDWWLWCNWYFNFNYKTEMPSVSCFDNKKRKLFFYWEGNHFIPVKLTSFAIEMKATNCNRKLYLVEMSMSIFACIFRQQSLIVILKSIQVNINIHEKNTVGSLIGISNS